MKNILNKLGLILLPDFTNLLIKTLRIKIHNLPDDKSNRIFIFWHSQMLVGWWLFRGKKYSSLVSMSKDGDLLSNLLLKWDYNVIRGSSSKGSNEALQSILNAVRQNNSVVITPDGPRGPNREIKNGVLIISNKCKVPIIPVKIVYSKKKILDKSWDNFEVPLPFSTCEIYFGKEFNYEKYLEDNELKNFKSSLAAEM